jgi:hypothetical protein
VAAPELDPSRDGPGAKPAAPGPADKR